MEKKKKSINDIADDIVDETIKKDLPYFQDSVHFAARRALERCKEVS